ncbi:hypothetical protein C1H46_026933 [Malus baccata]|uniref:Uncharacterized protein n=1 Tax=Malus baccata TaxID=106549 RepID=A0A540LM06_MALBA|nr:hypothetical protein C1H46_026933 [Malus baccata]
MAKRKIADNSTSTMVLNLSNNNRKQVHHAHHQHNTMKSRPIIFLLQNTSLTKGFVHKRWKILELDDDRDFLLKQNKMILGLQ